MIQGRGKPSSSTWLSLALVSALVGVLFIVLGDRFMRVLGVVWIVLSIGELVRWRQSRDVRR